MPIEISSAGILGGGVMGSGIGQALAPGGPQGPAGGSSGGGKEKSPPTPPALGIEELTKAVPVSGRPRFIGMHWFSPAPIMKLVELVHAPETAEETVQALESVCQRIGKVSVRVKDAPGRYGFIANRIYFAAVREARALLAEGVSSAENINKAMVSGFNWPVGPLAM